MLGEWNFNDGRRSMRIQFCLSWPDHDTIEIHLCLTSQESLQRSNTFFPVFPFKEKTTEMTNEEKRSLNGILQCNFWNYPCVLYKGFFEVAFNCFWEILGATCEEASNVTESSFNSFCPTEKWKKGNEEKKQNTKTKKRLKSLLHPKVFVGHFPPWVLSAPCLEILWSSPNPVAPCEPHRRDSNDGKQSRRFGNVCSLALLSSRCLLLWFYQNRTVPLLVTSGTLFQGLFSHFFKKNVLLDK